MNKSLDDSNSLIESPELNQNGVDFQNIFQFLLRNKKSISLFSILVTILSCLIFTFQKKTWKGEFQIVLENKNNPNQKSISLNKEMLLAEKWLGGGKSASYLETEVGILESPSILMPIFEFVKSQKIKQNKKFQDYKFKEWKENSLDINLKKGTSILELSYLDDDKDLIIPVLEKISLGYQNYSGKNKRRIQEITNNFFKDQILIFKKKSAKSLSVAQEYALDQDLVFYELEKGTLNNLDNNSKDLTSNTLLQAPNFLLPNIGIENARVQAANQIRKIDMQLQKIQDLNDSEELQYIGSTIPALVDEGLPNSLSNIEAALLEARSKYTDKDIAILNLIKKRNLTRDFLKYRIIKYLEVQKLNAEATMRAAMRPKDVLLKYKELIREAARDEQTLIQLEDNFNLFKLDLASQEDPWELITNPTLLDEPISPLLENYLLSGLFLGFFIGTLIAFFRENKTKIIYTTRENYMQKNSPIQFEVPLENKALLDETMNNIINSILIQENDRFAIIDCGDNNAETKLLLENIKNFASGNKKLEFIDKSRIENSFTKSILLIKLGISTKFDIAEINTRLQLNGIQNIGFVAINGISYPKNNLSE